MQHFEREPRVPVLVGAPGDVVAPVGGEGDRRRRDEGDRERQERREHLQRRPEEAGEGDHADEGADEHRADPDRVDVVEMRPLELDAGRAPAHRLVDHEVGDQRRHPGHRDDGVEAEDLLQHLVDAERHQHQRDGDVEHQPHHPAGMAVGQAREEVRPGDRARIGVRHVDLELGEDDEHAGEGERHLRREHRLERDQIHLRRLGGVDEGHALREREIGEEGAGQHLDAAGDDPARPGGQQRHPPQHVARRLAAARRAARQEAQEVHLLADLRHQREDHGGGGAEHHEVEGAVRRAEAAGIGGPAGERVLVHREDEDEGDEVQHQPEGLGPELEAADEGDAVRHQRDHHQRADEIADHQRHAEAHLQRQRHDRRLDGEEQIGEGGVDQRGDGRADIAEAGAAGEQVDVDAELGGVVADRQAGGEDDGADHEDGRHRVLEAVGQRDRPADRLQRQERDRAERGVGDAQRRPAARALGGEAQRVVFQRLVDDPLIVAAPNANDLLFRRHRVLPRRADARHSFALTLPGHFVVRHFPLLHCTSRRPPPAPPAKHKSFQLSRLSSACGRMSCNTASVFRMTVDENMPN